MNSKYKLYSKRLMIASILMVGGFFAFFINHSYFQNLRNAEKHTIERLYGIARTLSLQIDGDRHEQLICNFLYKDDITDNNTIEDYQDIHQLLKDAYLVNELNTPIYTIFKSNFCEKTPSTEGFLLLGVTSSQPHFRHPYTNPPSDYSAYFDHGGKIAEYYSDNGHWLSAFQPIKNSQGKTVAIVQIDESFCGFVQETRKAILKNILSALLFLGFLSLVFIYTYRRILSSMKDVNSFFHERCQYSIEQDGGKTYH